MKRIFSLTAILAPICSLILFFVPSIVYVNFGQGKTSYTNISPYKMTQWNNTEIVTYVWAFFAVALCISLIALVLHFKRPVFSCLNVFTFAYFWICPLVRFVSTGGRRENVFGYVTLHIGFYLALLFCCACVILFFVYCAKNISLNRKPISRKPSKSQRIAELERQVKELQQNNKDV